MAFESKSSTIRFYSLLSLHLCVRDAVARWPSPSPPLVRKLNLWLIKQRPSIRREKRKSRKTHFKVVLIDQCACALCRCSGKWWVCPSVSLLQCVTQWLLAYDTKFTIFWTQLWLLFILLRFVSFARAIRGDDNNNNEFIRTIEWIEMTERETKMWSSRCFRMAAQSFVLFNFQQNWVHVLLARSTFKPKALLCTNISWMNGSRKTFGIFSLLHYASV